MLVTGITKVGATLENEDKYDHFMLLNIISFLAIFLIIYVNTQDIECDSSCKNCLTMSKVADNGVKYYCSQDCDCN
ncbi:hypothetical protein F8M41_020748 [Gigaspora margarita]|uniref:Uncharacterized protein n=1 Tax=Gigaspora margarita TaxID=4874 RepID=A0A8H4AHV6_GIGMA|nr:hypothetical protein F8M41_020748 [Gigaspora margarita]